PAARPINELAKAYARAFADHNGHRDWNAVRDLFLRALADSNGEALHDLTEDLRMQGRRPGATVLIVIDAIEELLLANDQASDSFGTLLRMFQDSHGRGLVLLGTLRSDYLAEFQMHEPVRALSYEPIHLKSSQVDVRAVIEGPARIAGIELQPGLVDAVA